MTSLSSFDFSTLYTTLPHNLIKDIPFDLIVIAFQRESFHYLACNDGAWFSLQKSQNIPCMNLSKCM